jgi:RHH-type rel operon transcriptional repressor/antitoxin RelB
MSKLKMVGTRVEERWIEQIRAIANLTGQKESEVVRSAIAQYLGESDPTAIKGAIADLQARVINLEQKLGRLAG